MMNPLDLHALADGQLSPEEAQRVREALREDPVAAAEYNAILNLKDFLREKTPRQTSDEAWRASVARLNEIDRSRKVEGFVRKYAWALCGVFFLCIVSGRYMVSGTRGSSVQTADLIRLTSGLTQRQMPPTPEAIARDRFFDAIINRAKLAISNDRIQVLRAATGEKDGMQITELSIADKQGEMKLIIVPVNLNFQDAVEKPGDPTVYAGMIGKLNCVAWTSNGNSLILAGPRSHEDLQLVAGRICGSSNN